MQSTTRIEDMPAHRAFADGVTCYDGQAEERSAFEKLVAREINPEELSRQEKIDLCKEITREMLSFAADAIEIAQGKAKWKRIQRRVPQGYTMRYEKNEHETIVWPFVQMVNPAGEVVIHWEPARIKSIYKRRPHKGEKSDSVEIQILQFTNTSAAVSVGNRVLALAALQGDTYKDPDPERVGTRYVAMCNSGGILSIKALSGAGVAKKFLKTRQAESLQFKAMDAKILKATGGKSGARGLRHKANPNKGKTKEQIQIQTNPKP